VSDPGGREGEDKRGGEGGDQRGGKGGEDGGGDGSGGGGEARREGHHHRSLRAEKPTKSENSPGTLFEKRVPERIMPRTTTIGGPMYRSRKQSFENPHDNRTFQLPPPPPHTTLPPPEPKRS